MRYGVNCSIMDELGDIRTLVELARDAEAAGWDGFFIWDTLLFARRERQPLVDPWIALTAIAMSTERVRLGTAVTPLSRRRPWKLAREAVTLDHLSGGRLTLGVGLGDLNDPGFGRVGEVTDARPRGAMLDEALDVLAGLWSGEPFSYQGRH